MLILLVSLSVVALVATAVPLSRAEGWWARGFDFPRLQFSGIALALLVASLATLDLSRPLALASAATALVCLGAQAWWILPFTPLWRKEVRDAREPDPENAIRIMTANLLQTNRRAEDFLRIVRENAPDVLVALEADAWWQERLDALEARDGYAYSMKQPLENFYGMLVYSRLPLENARTQFLVEEGVPSMHALVRLRSGRAARIHFLHPAPPSPSENEESSERDAELQIVGASARHARAPVIVTGDLNDVAWSATTRLFRKTSRLLDPRVGRGMFNSYHAQRWFLRWPLDHLFCSRDFELKEIRRLPDFGSDHFPMLMELVCGDPPAEERGLEADADDEKWAQEKMADEGVHPNDVHEPDRS